jgi:uncharacterized protein
MKFPHDIEYKEFQFNRRRIILDVINSCFFEVSPCISDILRLGGQMGREELIKVLGQRYNQRDLGDGLRLFTRWREKGAFPERSSVGPLKPPSSGGVSLTLNVVNDCNLACRYCYAKGYMRDKRYMQKDIAQRSIDFLLDYIGDANYARVRLFGGEPLLNLPVIKDLIPYAQKRFKRRRKVIEFQLSTNGTLFDKDTIDLFRKINAEICLSIDGPEVLHNLHRPFRDGSGSYKNVVRWIEYLSKRFRPQKLMAVCVMSSQSQSPSRLYRFFRKLGFSTIFFQYCSYSPDIGFGPEKIDIPRHKKEFMDLGRRYLRDLLRGERFYVVHFGTVLRLRRFGCGMGRSIITIDPSGDIYACHRLQGVEEFRIGDVRKGFDTSRHRYYLNRTCETLDPCRRCWARTFCGGGCEAVNLKEYGKRDLIPSYYCEVAKFWIENSLRFLALLPEDIRGWFIKEHDKIFRRR